MAVQLTDSLLETVKQEILNNLKSIENKIGDFFEYPETGLSEELDGEIQQVQGSLEILGELKASELTSLILPYAKSIAKNYDDYEHFLTHAEDLATAYLSLKQYVDKLSISEANDPKNLLACIDKIKESMGEESHALEKQHKDKAILIAAEILDVINTYPALLRQRSKIKDVVSSLGKNAKRLMQSAVQGDAYEAWWLLYHYSMGVYRGELPLDNVLSNLLNDMRSALEIQKIEGESEHLVGQCRKMIDLLKTKIVQSETVARRVSEKQEYQSPAQTGMINLLLPVNQETYEEITLEVRQELVALKDSIERHIDGAEANIDMPAIQEKVQFIFNIFYALNQRDSVQLLQNVMRTLNEPVIEKSDWEKVAQSLLLVEKSLLTTHQDDQSDHGDAFQDQVRHSRSYEILAIQKDIGNLGKPIFRKMREDLLENETHLELEHSDDLVIMLHHFSGVFYMLNNRRMAQILRATECLTAYLAPNEAAKSNELVLKYFTEIFIALELVFDNMALSFHPGNDGIVFAEDAVESLMKEFNLSHAQLNQYAYQDELLVAKSRYNSDRLMQDTLTPTEAPFVPEVAPQEKPEESEAQALSETESFDDYNDESPYEHLELKEIRNFTKPASKEEFVAADIASLDEEFLEIFLEEIVGIYGEITSLMEKWHHDLLDMDVIKEIRRNFHTIKGSGRTVGLQCIGEFGWQHEDLLNRVLDDTIKPNPILRDAYREAIRLLGIQLEVKPFKELENALLMQAAYAEFLQKQLRQEGFQQRELTEDELKGVGKALVGEKEFSPILPQKLRDWVGVEESAPVSVTLSGVSASGEAVGATGVAAGKTDEYAAGYAAALKQAAEEARKNAERAAAGQTSPLSSGITGAGDALSAGAFDFSLSTEQGQGAAQEPAVGGMSLGGRGAGSDFDFSLSTEQGQGAAQEPAAGGMSLGGRGAGSDFDFSLSTEQGQGAAQEPAAGGMSLGGRGAGSDFDFSLNAGTHAGQQQDVESFSLSGQSTGAGSSAGAFDFSLDAEQGQGTDQSTAAFGFSPDVGKGTSNDVVLNAGAQAHTDAEHVAENFEWNGAGLHASQAQAEAHLFDKSLQNMVKRVLQKGTSGVAALDASTVAAISQVIAQQIKRADLAKDERVQDASQLNQELNQLVGSASNQDFLTAVAEAVSQKLAIAPAGQFNAGMTTGSHAATHANDAELALSVGGQGAERTNADLGLSLGGAAAKGGLQGSSFAGVLKADEHQDTLRVQDVDREALQAHLQGMQAPEVQTVEVTEDDLRGMGIDPEAFKVKMQPAATPDNVSFVDARSDVNDEQMLHHLSEQKLSQFTEQLDHLSTHPAMQGDHAMQLTDVEKVNAQTMNQQAYFDLVNQFDNIVREAKLSRPKIDDEFLNGIYDIEDRITTGAVPDWVWRLLDAMEQLALTLKSKNRRMNDQVADSFSRAAELLGSYDEAASNEVNAALNDLMRMRNSKEDDFNDVQLAVDDSAMMQMRPEFRNKVFSVYLRESRETLDTSKTHLQTWRDSQYQDEHALRGLQENVDHLSRGARDSNFQPAAELTAAAGTVVYKLVHKEIGGNKEVANAIENSLNELDRMFENIRQGGEGHVQPAVIDALRQVAEKAIPTEATFSTSGLDDMLGMGMAGGRSFSDADLGIPMGGLSGGASSGAARAGGSAIPSLDDLSRVAGSDAPAMGGASGLSDADLGIPMGGLSGGASAGAARAGGSAIPSLDDLSRVAGSDAPVMGGASGLSDADLGIPMGGLSGGASAGAARAGGSAIPSLDDLSRVAGSDAPAMGGASGLSDADLSISALGGGADVSLNAGSSSASMLGAAAQTIEVPASAGPMSDMDALDALGHLDSSNIDAPAVRMKQGGAAMSGSVMNEMGGAADYTVQASAAAGLAMPGGSDTVIEVEANAAPVSIPTPIATPVASAAPTSMAAAPVPEATAVEAPQTSAASEPEESLPEVRTFAECGIDETVVSIFNDEATDLLARAQATLDAWGSDGRFDDYTKLSEMQRGMHTLKGGARMCGFTEMGDLTHTTETLLERLSSDNIANKAAAFDILNESLWKLNTMLDNISMQMMPAPAPKMIKKIEEFVKNHGVLNKESSETPSPAPTAEAPAPMAGAAPSAVAAAAGVASVVAPTVVASSVSEVPNVIQTVVAGDASTVLAAAEAAPETPAEPESASVEEVPEETLPRDFASHNIDSVMAGIFSDESNDIIVQTTQTLAYWKNDPQSEELPNQIKRGMHTIKGGARMVGFIPLGDLSHAIETLLDELLKGRLSDFAASINMIEEGVMQCQLMLDDIRREVFPDEAVPYLNKLQDYVKKPIQGARKLGEQAPAKEKETAPQQAKAQEASPTATVVQTRTATAPTQVVQNIAGASSAAAATLATVAPTASSSVASVVAPSVQGATPSEATHIPVRPTPAISRSGGITPAMSQMVSNIEKATRETGKVQQTPPPAPEEHPDTKTAEQKPDFKFGDQIGQGKTQIDLASPQRLGANKGKKVEIPRFVRVDANLLDEMINMIGETSILRSRIEKLIADSDFNLNELSRTATRIGEQMRRLDNETEAQILFRRDVEHADDEAFDPLEMDRFSEIQQLSRQLAEAIEDLKNLQSSLSEGSDSLRKLTVQQGNLQRNIQDKLISTQLMRFDANLQRLQRLTKQTATSLGKEVELILEGGDVEVERRMLDDVLAPLEHMIRNSISHGIEMPEERKKLGKPATGVIKVIVEKQGSEIIIRVIDNGRGLDFNSIREKARSRGMLDESKANDEHYLSSLLFLSGFSTAKTVTQVSGRGVGMDVVADMVKRRRGHVSVLSAPGQGSQFTIRLPYSMSIADVLLVEISKQTYAIPMLSIDAVSRTPAEEIKRVINGEKVEHTYAGHEYEIRALGPYFALGQQYEMPEDQDMMSLLLMEVTGQPIALHVDRILSRLEIIVKNVNQQVLNLPGISGATILGDGQVVPVLELVDLARRFSSLPSYQAQYVPVEETRPPRVLIVDDSVTMRKVGTRLLERHGIEVEVGKDGLDAISVIEHWIPDLILLDIEMPRMDGFEFATHVRQKSAIPNVPIIMVTSRTGEKHRERADQIGVNGYLGKPYQEDVLIATIYEMLGLSNETAKGQ